MSTRPKCLCNANNNKEGGSTSWFADTQGRLCLTQTSGLALLSHGSGVSRIAGRLWKHASSAPIKQHTQKTLQLPGPRLYFTYIHPPSWQPYVALPSSTWCVRRS